MFGGKNQSSKTPPPQSAKPAAAVPASAAPAKQEIAAVQSAVTPKLESHIASGMEITGDMVGDGDVLVDGKLNGNLRCHATTIGKDGCLDGTITAEDVIVHGTVDGDIKAKRVQLMPNAVMRGDVVHEILEVAAGAQVEGRYSRTEMKAATWTAGATLPEGSPPKAPSQKGADDKPVEASGDVTAQASGNGSGSSVSGTGPAGPSSGRDSKPDNQSKGGGATTH